MSTSETAQIGASQALVETRRDWRENRTQRRAMPTRDLLSKLRGDRERMTAEHLMRRCRDAASLSMGGAMYSTEDRADCAAEVCWQVLASIPGNGLPMRDDRRADLSTLRGLAQNFRRALDRKREHTAAYEREATAQRAATWTAALDFLEDRTLSTDGAAEDASDAATAAVKRLHLPADGAVWTALYAAQRQAQGLDTARIGAELGKSASVHHTIRAGSAALRLAYPDPGELIQELIGVYVGRAADGTLIYSARDERQPAPYRGVKLEQPWREGTAAGERPDRPATADLARAECAVTFRRGRRNTRDHARRMQWTAYTAGGEGTTYYRRHPVGVGKADKPLTAVELRRVTDRALESRAPSKLQRMADSKRVQGAILGKGKTKAVHYSAKQYGA